MAKFPTGVVAICAILLCASLAYAQDVTKVELYGGYTYTRGEDSTNSNGFTVSLAASVSRSFSLVTEIGGIFDKESRSFRVGSQSFSESFSSRVLTYMSGPRYSFRNRTRFTPFAQVLVGGYRISNDFNFSSTQFNSSGTFTLNSFATAAGGGLDIRINRRFAVRAAQVDYLYLRKLPFNNGTRLSTGLVVKF